MNDLKKSNNFILHGIILASSGILVRMIGLVYRIPLLRIITSQGNGFYSAAFNVYSIILILSSYSLPLAVSKLISARISKEDYINARRIFVAALVYATLAGGTGCIFVWFFAEYLSNNFFKLPYSYYALKSLAPTIWIMGYVGVLRGYFQGHRTMIPTALSQIIEQVVNAAVSLLAAYYLMKYISSYTDSIEKIHAYGAMGGTIGTGAGAFTALLLLLILYLFKVFKERKIKKNNVSPIQSYKSISKVLLLTVVPVIASTAVYNINGVIDISIFSNMMNFLNSNYNVVERYGSYTGEFIILINVPVAVSNALSSSLIPELSRAISENNSAKLHVKMDQAFRFCTIVSFPAFIGFLCLADPIMKMLFNSDAIAINMMKLGCIAIVFYSISTISNAILQGSNNINIPVKNSLTALFLHIIVLVTLLLFIKEGVYALVIANVSFALFMCLLNSHAIKKRLYYKTDIVKCYVKPLISSLLMGVVVYSVYYILKNISENVFILSIIPMFSGVILYPIFLVKTGTLAEDDLRVMPKGRYMISLLKKIRVL